MEEASSHDIFTRKTNHTKNKQNLKCFSQEERKFAAIQISFLVDIFKRCKFPLCMTMIFKDR